MEQPAKPAKIVQVREYKTFIGGGILWFLFGLFLYFILIPAQIAPMSPINGTSPRTIPTVLAVLFLIFGTMLAINGYVIRNAPNQKVYTFNLSHIRLVFYSLLVISANIIAFMCIGYIIPAIVTMAALMLLYGNRSYFKIAAYSIAIPLIIDKFFALALQMYLP